MASRVRWLGAKDKADIIVRAYGYPDDLGRLGDVAESKDAIEKLVQQALPLPPNLQNQGIGDLQQALGDTLSNAAQGALGDYSSSLKSATQGVSALANGDTQGAINAGIDIATSAGLAPVLGPAAIVVGPVIGGVAKAIFGGIFGGAKEESAAQIRHKQLVASAQQSADAFLQNEEAALLELQRAENNITSMTAFAAASVFAAAHDMGLPTPVNPDDWEKKLDDPYVQRCAEEAKKLLRSVGITANLYLDSPLGAASENAYNSQMSTGVAVGSAPKSRNGLYYKQLIKFTVDEKIYGEVYQKKGKEFLAAFDADFKDITAEKYKYTSVDRVAWWNSLPSSSFLGVELNNAFNPATGTQTPCWIPTSENNVPGGSYVGGESLVQSHSPAAWIVLWVEKDSVAAQIDSRVQTSALVSRHAQLDAPQWDYFNQLGREQGAAVLSEKVTGWNSSGTLTDQFLGSIPQFLSLQWKYHVSARISAHLSMYRSAIAQALHNFTKNQLKDRIRRNAFKFGKAYELAADLLPRSPSNYARVVSSNIYLFALENGDQQKAEAKAKVSKLSPVKTGKCGYKAEGLTEAERLVWKFNKKLCDSSAKGKSASDEWSAAYNAWVKKNFPSTPLPRYIQTGLKTVVASKNLALLSGTPDSGPASPDAFAKAILTGDAQPPAGWKAPPIEALSVSQAPSAGGGGGSASDNTPMLLLGLGVVAALGYFLMKDKKG